MKPQTCPGPQYSPGRDEQISRTRTQKFQVTIAFFKLWLSYLKREVEAPDLWASIQTKREDVSRAIAPGADNSKFTEGEQELLAQKLDTIAGLLSDQLKLGDESKRLLEQQFEFLKEESKTQGRRSWMQIALGTVVTLVIEHVITNEGAQTLLNQFSQLLVPIVVKTLESGL